MSYADANGLRGRGRERVLAAGMVMLVQGGIVAALLSGLAVNFVVKPHDKPFTTYQVRETPPPPPNEMLPPDQPSHTATRPLVITPLPPIDLPPTTNTLPMASDSALPPAIDAGPVAPVQPTATLTPDLARGVRFRGVVADWFPHNSYPPAALRAGAEGRVGVAVTVSPAGRATGCEVVASSGNGDLDQTTCRLALRNGRFEPARDGGGNAVASRVVLPKVRWTLEK